MATLKPYEKADGTLTYKVLFRHGGRQTSRTFASFEEAERAKKLIDVLGADRGLAALAVDDDPELMTLDELAEKWLAAKRKEVTPRIHRGYGRDYANWISDRLGNRAAEMITEVDVQEWVDWMQAQTERPLSAKSIADRHAILHQIYRWGMARTRAHVTHNPCKETSLPARRKKPPRGLRLSELHQMLEAGAGIDEQDAADLTAFLAGTGWRISEGIALLTDSVEIAGKEVYVTMDRVHRQEVGWVDDAKSIASFGRRLRVLGPGADVVRRRVAGKGPGEFVFTFTPRGGPTFGIERPWNIPSFRDRRWPVLVEAAGLKDRKPTPHWLRHTHVLVCHDAGMSMAEISRRLGHEDIQTTINIYGRLIEDMSEDVADRAHQLMSRPVEVRRPPVSALRRSAPRPARGRRVAGRPVRRG